MKNEPRITPSKLGALCGENPCLRCYWYLLRLSFKKPFDFGTPYIMQLLDQRQKQIARVALAEEGELPRFFGPFRSATKLINVMSLSAYHEETKLKLFGMPDLLFENKDGTRMVIDDKTAFPKTEDDALFHKYQAQVNFYGLLCELAAEAYEISRVGILYYVYEPVTDDDVLDTTGPSTITVQFTPRLTLVDYDPQRIVVPLLKKVRALLDMDTPPDSVDGCQDCKLLKEFSKASPQKDDLQYLRKIMNDREWREYQAQRQFDELTSSPSDIQKKTEMLVRQAMPGGVLANWDFDPEPREADQKRMGTSFTASS
jgi:hypothetical protein